MLDMFGVRIFSFKDGKIILEEEHTPQKVKDITQKIIKENFKDAFWQRGDSYFQTIEACGIEYEINYKGIKDYDKFLEGFIREIRPNRNFTLQKNTPIRNGMRGDPKYEVAGVPDYTLRYDDGELVHVEMKRESDSLKKRQLEWIYKYSLQGEECWVFWIEDKDV